MGHLGRGFLLQERPCKIQLRGNGAEILEVDRLDNIAVGSEIGCLTEMGVVVGVGEYDDVNSPGQVIGYHRAEKATEKVIESGCSVPNGFQAICQLGLRKCSLC